MIFGFLACAHQSRRPINTSKVVFVGGQYADKHWDQKLVFTKYSWFKGATLENELLLSKLNKESAFSAWLGPDNKQLDDCSELLIVVAYAKVSAAQGKSNLYAQIEKAGFKRIDLLEFSRHLEAHQNYTDWKLTQHKIVGFCRNNLSRQPIEMIIPGFPKKALTF